MPLDQDIAKFTNDGDSVLEIEIGVKHFKCIGVSPPQDHPHLYLVMPDSGSIRCFYCNTNFIYNPELKPNETKPAGNFFVE